MLGNKANSDPESDELLCLWESTQKEMEENCKRAQAELERIGPERYERIRNWLKEHTEEELRTNEKRKRTCEEEQQQTECKLLDARQLEEELLWRSAKLPPGWMTIDRCIQVCLPKQVADDHAECMMRRWRLHLLRSVASVRKHNRMFYFGIAACPHKRATYFNIGHLEKFNVMHILAYGPSPMIAGFEDFLIKYSWMQSDELQTPRCLNQKAGRGGQGTKKMEGYLYYAEREPKIDDHDLEISKDRQRFLKNDEEKTEIQQMLEISPTRSNTNTDATTNNANTDPDTDTTDTDATNNQ